MLTVDNWPKTWLFKQVFYYCVESTVSDSLKIPSEFEVSSTASVFCPKSLLWLGCTAFFCYVKFQAKSWSCKMYSFCSPCSFWMKLEVVSALCLQVVLLYIDVNSLLLITAVFLELKLADTKCVLFWIVNSIALKTAIQFILVRWMW